LSDDFWLISSAATAQQKQNGKILGSGAAIFPALMPNSPLPPAAIPADLPGEVRLQIVSSCAEPPARGGWLHEVKHEGHRLVAIVANGSGFETSRNLRNIGLN